MVMAARPTLFMVIPLNTYDSMAPTRRPQTTMGSRRESLAGGISARTVYAEKRARETRAAEPVAKPLPLVKLVLPAASRASVRSRTCSPSLHISAMPPALSLMGPYPSMVRPMARVESMPRAAMP
jgi:hypothetical protein